MEKHEKSSLSIKIETRGQFFYTIIRSDGEMIRSECFHTRAAAILAGEMFIKQFQPTAIS